MTWNVQSRILGVVLLGVAASCSSLEGAQEYVVSPTVSVRVEANVIALDAKSWDVGSEIVPMLGNFILPGWGPSPNPDLELTIIASDADPLSLNDGVSRAGNAHSSCPDALVCRWSLDVPDGAFALVISDLDPGLSSEFEFGSLQYFFGNGTRVGTGPGDGSAPPPPPPPLTTSRTFVAAYLLPGRTGRLPSEEELQSLEDAARRWMMEVGVSRMPRLAIPVADDLCLSPTGCAADNEANAAALRLIDPQRP